MKKIHTFILIFIIYLFNTINFAISATNDDPEIILKKGTILSVKLKDNFSNLKIGDEKNLVINPRTLRSKKIKWNSLAVSLDNPPYIIGKVFDVTNEYSIARSSNVDKLQMNFKSIVINNIEYPIKAQFKTIDNSNKATENTATYNYNLILLDNVYEYKGHIVRSHYMQNKESLINEKKALIINQNKLRYYDYKIKSNPKNPDAYFNRSVARYNYNIKNAALSDANTSLVLYKKNYNERGIKKAEYLIKCIKTDTPYFRTK